MYRRLTRTFNTLVLATPRTKPPHSPSNPPPTLLTPHPLHMSTTAQPTPTLPPTTAPSRLLGVRFTHLSPSRVEARYTVTADHLQPGKLLHGGVNALVGEEVASTAAGLNVPHDHTIVGTRITLNHVRSAVAGDVVTVSAVPVHVGKQTHLWEIRAEKESAEGGEKKLLSIGDMQAFVKQPRNQSKL